VASTVRASGSRDCPGAVLRRVKVASVPPVIPAINPTVAESKGVRKGDPFTDDSRSGMIRLERGMLQYDASNAGK
jgi:hypothetical protein